MKFTFLFSLKAVFPVKVTQLSVHYPVLIKSNINRLLLKIFVNYHKQRSGTASIKAPRKGLVIVPIY